MSRISRMRSEILVSLFLIAITVAVFGQVLGHAFVRYDDDVCITLNQAVQSGLNRGTITWAFLTRYNANWHPLTWLSLMADYEVWGLNPRGFHLTNLLLHTANVLLLFLILRRMTGSVWRSGFVAVLFAVHPLHVESVAWAAERKDVLSTFLWLLVMGAYALYAERPSAGRQLLVGFLFLLGLVAKPMLVTLPFVLLLMDYWPLRRMRLPREKPENRKSSLTDLVLEKTPLFAFSLMSCVITYNAQQQGGAFSGPDVFPLPVRIWNALVSSIAYIWKMLLPIKLAVFYPHPENTIPVWQIVGSALLLACITLVVLRASRPRPYLLVGWLWYLVTLAPVIGLVQVGVQGMADRYTYVPLIGLFIMIAWGIPDLLRQGDKETGRRGDWVTRGLGVSGVLVIVGLASIAWAQVGCWKDSVTLFDHAVHVTKNNALAYANLGLSLSDEQRIEEATDAYRESLRINPVSGKVHHNLAVALFHKGDYAEAWREVHLAERYGIQPVADFVKALAEKMPEPLR